MLGAWLHAYGPIQYLPGTGKVLAWHEVIALKGLPLCPGSLFGLVPGVFLSPAGPLGAEAVLRLHAGPDVLLQLLVGIGTAFPLALRLECAVQRQGLAPGRHAQVASLLHRAAGGCVKGVHAGGLSRFAAGNVAVPVDEHFHLDLEVAVQARRRTPVPPKLLECAGNIAVVGCAACDDPCGRHGRRRDREQDGKQKRRKRTKMKTCGHGIPRWNRKPGLSVAGQARASGDRGAGSPRTLET